MHLLFALLLFPLIGQARSFPNHPTNDTASPLASFSAEWNHARFSNCHTAAQTDYLTSKEKNVFYILNLARQHPRLFLTTVIEKYPEYIGEENLRQSPYYKSLVTYLKQKNPQPILYPDQTLYESARCHALTSGETSYVGHKRRTQACKKVESFLGECCDYGYDDPLSIVMDLLIDEDIPDLGHRLIMFNPYTKLGVSIQPHKKYRWNAVLDFK
ncbi:MAG: CAP domain-containing protein [Bacteroidetes bacterium]|nr:CAP domain-containing protein [Bacteroidota bacterium]